MKAICLILVRGGVAYPVAPPHVDCRVIDRDNIEAGDYPVALPRGVGFETLVEEHGLIERIDYVWEVEGDPSGKSQP